MRLDDYEQFADTILIDVTLRVGMDEAGRALVEPGVLDVSPALELELELGEVVPVTWTLWLTCWLRFTLELPADRTYVLPLAELLALDELELDALELELLSLAPPS